jgi:hypothetical protein
MPIAQKVLSRLENGHLKPATKADPSIHVTVNIEF